MIKKIIAIIFIFGVTTVAWMVLGALTESRTGTFSSSLQGKVSELWGPEHQQKAPRIYYQVWSPNPDKDKAPLISEYEILPEKSDIKVKVNLDQRKKGLIWYSTYGVSFNSLYSIKNTTTSKRTFLIDFYFPSTDAIYDNFHFSAGGKEIGKIKAVNGVASAELIMEPGEEKSFEVGYDSQGMDRWHYGFGDNVSQVKNFNMEVTTNFKDIDFPERTISPTVKEATDHGWRLVWKYKNLISGFRIGLQMPQKINPGQLASQISFFAPVSLLFFFFIIFVLSVIKQINLHPMNYFFLAGAFFSFHLLFSYLVDHIDINLAFIIASITSVGLVVSYLRLVVGNRFAFVEAGLAQIIYLVLFSYAHFFKGFTGLTITIGSILTLFVIMQVTGRVNWEESFKIHG